MSQSVPDRLQVVVFESLFLIRRVELERLFEKAHGHVEPPELAFVASEVERNHGDVRKTLLDIEQNFARGFNVLRAPDA